jgi:hypothetical protein
MVGFIWMLVVRGLSLGRLEAVAMTQVWSLPWQLSMELNASGTTQGREFHATKTNY